MKILIAGGGPAGIKAALRARELGADVTLLESSHLGGTAFNEGPAPVRALARAARLRADAALFPAFGLDGTIPRVDFKSAIANANRISAYANHVRHLTTNVRDAGIRVVDDAGPARFVDRMALEVADGRRFEGDRIILAVGGHPRKLPIPGNELALSFHDLWALEALPTRVTVVGGSATGCQLASILLDFGAHVDLIEFADRISPSSDAAISHGLRAAFAERGMNVLVGTKSEGIEAANGHLRVFYQRDGVRQSLETDAVFLMVGWPANLSALAPDVAGITMRGPYIEADDYLRTSVPEIFAAGDANGISMLVQSAVLQGGVAAENAVLGPKRIYTPHAVASGSFTNPEYGSVGMTEAQARTSHDCVVEVVTYDGLPRAIMDARTDGMCKLIVDKETLTLLGAHVLGSYSAEVIQVAATCMAARMCVTRIAALELAFPTFTEAIGIAARRIVRKLELASPEWTGNGITEVE
jgi:pyruvate/2-oxoglutarate dehydrogenase complex dihydrolipoamide dehydrogenase (E3) component